MGIELEIVQYTSHCPTADYLCCLWFLLKFHPFVWPAADYQELFFPHCKGLNHPFIHECISSTIQKIALLKIELGLSPWKAGFAIIASWILR